MPPRDWSVATPQFWSQSPFCAPTTYWKTGKSQVSSGGPPNSSLAFGLVLPLNHCVTLSLALSLLASVSLSEKWENWAG